MSEAAERCPFTGGGCDGGEVRGGTVGCAFKDGPSSRCAWTADVPAGESPRDFYNRLCMEAAQD